MLELLAYLRANGFKTFIVSGGGIEFHAAWTERIYGVPPEQVVGSSIKTRFEMRDGTPVLFSSARGQFHRRQGRQAHRHQTSTSAAARSQRFGNSDGDLEMLQWTTLGTGGARLGLIVTIPMRSANMPMTASRHSGSST